MYNNQAAHTTVGYSVCKRLYTPLEATIACKPHLILKEIQLSIQLLEYSVISIDMFVINRFTPDQTLVSCNTPQLFFEISILHSPNGS